MLARPRLEDDWRVVVVVVVVIVVEAWCLGERDPRGFIPNI